MKLYGDARSGNCYKLQLLLAHLDRPYEWVPKDILRGETRQPDFLAKNPNGRIPLLELEDGRCLAESNAILCYLAEGSDWLPADAWTRAQVLQWLFFEQYSHEPYIAVARFIIQYLGRPVEQAQRLASLYPPGHAALGVMEAALQGRDFLCTAGPSVADIALYAYTHCAAEAEFDLTSYPAIRAWLTRIAALPGHREMAHA